MSKHRDDLLWRVSKDGYSIKQGWGEDKVIIAKCPFDPLRSFNAEAFEKWLDNAEDICEKHNALL